MQLYMKTILTMALLTAGFWVHGQKITGKVEGHSKGEMDIVLTMFGLDNPVKIGTLDKNGDIEIDLSGYPVEKLSEEELDAYFSDLRFGFQYRCGDPTEFPEGEGEFAVNAGYIALWANDIWSGSLSPVSDSMLSLWVADYGYNDAVPGSFYKFLLVTEDIELKKKCITYDSYNDESVEVELEYDLKLKKGLNLIEYQIGAVYKTDPAIRASFPVKIRMVNAGNKPEIIWKAKYFY